MSGAPKISNFSKFLLWLGSLLAAFIGGFILAFKYIGGKSSAVSGPTPLQQAQQKIADEKARIASLQDQALADLLNKKEQATSQGKHGGTT